VPEAGQPVPDVGRPDMGRGTATSAATVNTRSGRSARPHRVRHQPDAKAGQRGDTKSRRSRRRADRRRRASSRHARPPPQPG
jgi:hypothetical protein